MKQSTTSPGKTQPLYLINQRNANAEQENEHAEAFLPLLHYPARRGRTLASLSAQNTAPRAQRDTGTMFVREQVVDCSNKNPSEVCVISYASETTR